MTNQHDERGLTRLRFIFTGRVQHVGFRYTAYYFTRGLYITGWVDNLPDGRVELEAQGPPMQLQKLLSKLKGQFEIDHVAVEKLPVLPQRRPQGAISNRGTGDGFF